MKVAGGKVAATVERPGAEARAFLLYGPEPALTAQRRATLVRALLGADDDPFRLARLDGDAVRKDGAALVDEVAALSFGGGERVVVATGVTDAASDPVIRAMEAAGDGARLVVTADALSAKSKIRKAFEEARDALALPCYPPEGRALLDEAAAHLEASGGEAPSQEGRTALAGALEGRTRGEALRLAELLALWDGPVEEAVAALAPPAGEAGWDEGIAAVMEGRARDLPPLMDRYEAQGASLAGLVRVLSNHLARLHRVQSAVEAGGDLGKAMGALKPPLFFKLRDAFASQARRWPRRATEAAWSDLSALEAQMRAGGTPVPERAAVERALMRIALGAPGR